MLSDGMCGRTPSGKPVQVRRLDADEAEDAMRGRSTRGSATRGSGRTPNGGGKPKAILPKRREQMTLDYKLREYLLRYETTFADVAATIGVSTAQLKNLRDGRTRLSLGQAHDLAFLFGCTLDELWEVAPVINSGELCG